MKWRNVDGASFVAWANLRPVQTMEIGLSNGRNVDRCDFASRIQMLGYLGKQ